MSGLTCLAIIAPNGAAATPPISRPMVAVVKACQPSATMKVDGDRHRQEEFGGVDGADGLARVAALDEQVGSDDGAPAAAAGRIEEAADQAQRLDDLRPLLGMAVHDAAVEQIEAERGQIGQHDRLGDVSRRLGQHIGAEHAADDAGNDDAHEQPPVDIAMRDMADRRDAGGEGLGGVDAGRGDIWAVRPMRSAGCWKSAHRPCPARHRSAARRSRRR